MFAPLSLVGCKLAFSLWAVISVGFFFVSGYLLRDELKALRTSGRIALVTFLLVPTATGLTLGQDHGLFLVLWALVFHKLQSDDDFNAGVFVGLALIRYQFALPVLLFFVVLGKRRLLRGFLVSSAGLALLSYAIVGPRLFGSYLALMHALLRADAGGLLAMPSLRGFAALVTPSHTVAVTVGCTALLLTWAVAKVRHLEAPDALALAMIVAMLVDYHAFSYELPVLAIPLVLFLYRYPRYTPIVWGLGVLSLIAGLHQHGLMPLLCPVLLVWLVLLVRLGEAHTEAAKAVPVLETK